MADKPAPRGRGAALLQAFRKRQEEKELGVAVAESSGSAASTSSGVQQESQEPRKIGGRGGFLARLRAKQLEKAGSDSPARVGAGDASSGPIKTPAAPPTSVQEVTKGISEVSVTEKEPLFYRGEAGKKINASSNYIRLLVAKDRGIFEYEVRFDPPLDAKSRRIRTVNMHMRELKSAKVYDGGALLYLPTMITDTQLTFKGVLPNSDDTDEITMTIIYKKKRRMGECLHLYNVLFKRIMHILLFTQMGKNYFSPHHKYVIPQHKLEVFPGFAVSVDELEDGLMICLDTQHRVLRSQSVYSLMNELRCIDHRRFKELAVSQIIGSIVFTPYNNNTYIVDDISWDLTPKDTFPTRDGGTMSFIEYYKKQYDIDIQDIDQPMLINRKSVKVAGSLEKQDRVVCLVPELCNMTGMSDAMRNDWKVMKDVAQFTRVTPHQRIQALRTYLDNVSQSEKVQELLNSWGLTICPSVVEFNARILEPETLIFGDNRSIRCPPNADWNRAVGENKALMPVNLHKWIVFYTVKDQRFANEFAMQMVKFGPAMGANIAKPQLIALRDDRNESYATVCREHISKEVQCAVFICPSLRGDRYSIIKKICCVEIPVASQVILAKTLSNPSKSRQIIFKIALQINCKLGGSLWTCRFPFKGWMICGIDVYHGQKDKSVCGFTASLNESMSTWFNTSIFQTHELGDFFRSSFTKALEQYKNINGAFPSKIVIYRDGVGDGQLDQCLKYEVSQFEDVLRSFQFETTICFIVVQKRISTRIFVTDKNEYTNPQPGTIVDSVVTRRHLYDFFLVSQNVRQGTVNPTHYIVLHDTCKIKPDNVQRLSHKLCHLYYNWAGTIRVPAPCQYAHKLAQIVGQQIQKAPSSVLSTRLWYL